MSLPEGDYQVKTASPGYVNAPRPITVGKYETKLADVYVAKKPLAAASKPPGPTLAPTPTSTPTPTPEPGEPSKGEIFLDRWAQSLEETANNAEAVQEITKTIGEVIHVVGFVTMLSAPFAKTGGSKG